MSASIDSVHLFGDWLMDGITFWGTHVALDPDIPLLGVKMASLVGTFEVTNSRFETKRTSLWFTGLYNSRVRVSNNEFTSVFGLGGAAFTKSFASDIKVYRCEADNCAGVTIGRFDWYFEMLDTEPSRSRYYISRNTIHRDAPIPFGGIEMWDSPESPTIRAIIYHNTIVSPGHFAVLGPIVGNYVDNALVVGNKFEGAGSSAINVLAGSRWLILSNDFRDYDSSAADILLDSESSDCLVVGGWYPATVYDQGIGNAVVGRATRV